MRPRREFANSEAVKYKKAEIRVADFAKSHRAVSVEARSYRNTRREIRIEK